MTDTDTPPPSSKYPAKRTWGDYAHSASKAVVGAVPYLGAAGSELISLIAPPLDRARAEFINDLAERLEKVEQVVDEDELVSFVFGSVQSAMATTSREKRELLANAVVNFAMGRGGDQAEYFRSLIGRLTVGHVKVLRFFAEAHPGKMLQPNRLVEDAAQRIIAEAPDLRGREGLVEAIVQELWDLRFLPFPRRAPPTLHQNMIDLHTLDGPRLSDLGHEFLEFISAPKEPPTEEASRSET